MITLTFPDGAKRQYDSGDFGGAGRRLNRKIPGKEGRRRRDQRRAVRSRRSDRGRCDGEDRHPRRSRGARTHPPRLRPCAGRGGAGAVSRNPGDHRPGDRERLLLRFLPQPAVHAGGLPGDRKENARDHRPRQALHQIGEDRARRRRNSSARKARCSRSNWSMPSPSEQEIKFYDQGGWVDLCRGPAHDIDGQDRQCLQADEGGGRLLAGRCEESDAHPHLRHGLGQRQGFAGLCDGAGGSREARSPQARPRDGPVSFPGRGAGRRLLACQGLDRVPAAHRLYAPPPVEARLSGSERAAASRQVPVGDIGPLGLVPRGHVHGALGRR